MAEPLKGITAENYYPLAKAFIGAQGHGFVIVRDLEWATHEFAHSPREWGAWMAYFAAKKLPRLTIERKGIGTVPAQWPHIFDADWKAAADTHGADRYVAGLAKETRVASGVVDAAARKTFITNRLGYDPAKRRGTFNEPAGEEQAPMLIDKDLLLECYDADMAALQARKAGKVA